MDRQDGQDKEEDGVKDASLKHVAITRTVIGCAFEVILLMRLLVASGVPASAP